MGEAPARRKTMRHIVLLCVPLLLCRPAAGAEDAAAAQTLMHATLKK